MIAMETKLDIPGLTRSYSGHWKDYDLTVAEVDDGLWEVSLAIGAAFSDSDDLSGRFASEHEALAVVREMIHSGVVPTSFTSPRDERDTCHSKTP
jgi:hypothetical protein